MQHWVFLDTILNEFLFHKTDHLYASRKGYILYTIFYLFSSGNSNNTNGQSHQVNNHQNSNSGNVLPSPEMYWGKADIGESSPPSMCLPSNGQGSILGRQGSEGPDDLRVTNLGQHHPTQPPTPTNPYDALANALASSKGASASAFTPIQTVVLNNVIYFSSFFHFI